MFRVWFRAYLCERRAGWKNPEISKLNSYLEQIRSQLTNHYQDLVVNKQEVTPDAIKNKFLGEDELGVTLKGL